ncbi:hypothetical protein CHU32_21245 [Superficieibacter electus]|uniref:Uncharacterized protein n=1 Tax=Superficieibacter electus TaxID=2022662 RepID=A0A2P5GJY7_9ENTR|nr:hypothetical protein [Superficieibacter electus]POP42174.1 hypothetical protein CHU33_20360 [Superficieibacter electus]POP44481.1 hypothetical protein CHU32_21245 [Superficieibacter electus]
MRKWKTKDDIQASTPLFEKVLVRGYQVALVIFSLWLGWVIYDEVQMQRHAVPTSAQIYHLDYITPEQAAEKGLCQLRGRSANCSNHYSFTVEYQVNGRKRTAQFQDIVYNPGENKTICLDYVKSNPAMIKLCRDPWFDYHKDFFFFPFAFWSLTLLGAFGISLILAAEKVKRRFQRPPPPVLKECWYHIYDDQTGQLLLDTACEKDAFTLLNQKRVISCRAGKSEVVVVHGRKTQRSWIIYTVEDRRRRHKKKKSSI